MSSEIATWGMIRAKMPAFPAPAAGQDNECLTKSEILNMEGVEVNGNYDDNECPVIEHVVPTKDIALGYVDANNKVHYIATLMNNPTFSRAEIKSIIGDNNTIIIFTGYSNFMNATSHMTTMERRLGEAWIRIPCVDNSGSCDYNSPLTRIDDYSCYTGGFNALMMEARGFTGDYRFIATAVDTSNGTEESSLAIYFTLTD